VRLLDQFFDRGLCFATEGYERYAHLQNGFQSRGREAQAGSRGSRELFQTGYRLMDSLVKLRLLAAVISAQQCSHSKAFDFPGLIAPLNSKLECLSLPIGQTGHRYSEVHEIRARAILPFSRSNVACYA